MAQYNADIRIGVTGKTQLNQLENQLKRTQTTLNKLNKSLNLRAKVQAIKLDTRAANTQIKNLEQRINRLGRTITVNLRVNEKEGKKSGGNNNTTILSSNNSKQQNVGLSALLATSAKLKDTDRERLKIAKQLTPVLEQQNAKQKEIKDQVAKINKNRTEATNVSNGFGTKARLNQLNFGYAALLRKLQRLRGEYKGITTEVRGYQRAADSVNDDAIIRAERRRQRVAELRRKKQRGASIAKGAGAGLAASGLSIPGLGNTSAGALAGAYAGGPAGAAFGAAVGFATDLTQGFAAATAEVTKFNNQLKLSQKALANTVFSGEELAAALASIDSISDDFLVPIGDATKQFTKLNAAARASGFGVDEVAEVYRGLAAANVALGGDAERLNGILLATQQVFSKGKVQAEELRGQIGERLAGAFAKFAESAGLSTSQLDKALEKGEVSLEDFVRFSKSLLDEYEEDAKRLATEPENAAARLKLAMDDLKKAAGPILQSIGNAFTELANAAVQSLTKMLNAINDFRMAAAKGKYQETRRNLKEQRDQLATDVANSKRDTFIKPIGSDQIIASQTRAVQAAKAANDRAFGDLNRLRQQMLPAIEASGNPLPTKLTEPPTGGNDKAKGGGAGPKGPTDRSDELLLEIKYQTRLNELQKQQVVGNERAVQANQTFMELAKLRIDYETELERIDQQDLTNASKTYAKELERLKLLEAVGEVELNNAQLKFDRNEELKTTLRGLQEQIDIEGALTDEAKLQAEWAARIAELQADGSYDPAEKVKLEAKINQLYSQRLALLDPLVQYQRELERSLGDTRGKIASLARTVESELGTALSNAITGLIDGTTTVEEAFSNMFANIGKAFIDMATQMLAQKAILMLLSAFTGGAGGGAAAGAQGIGAAAAGGFSFAGGGYTGDGPRAGGVDGQGGFPAILHPQEYVYDGFADARNAMGGSGGGGGEDGGGLSSEAINRSFSENSSSITMTNSYMRERSMERESMAVMGGAGSMVIETQVINNVEYASVEQVQAAAAGAAKQARAQVFSDMKNKPARRAMVGLK